MDSNYLSYFKLKISNFLKIMRIIFKQVNFKFKNLKSILLTNFPARKRNLNSFVVMLKKMNAL